MIYHHDISDAVLRSKIKQKVILLAGNRNLKIYGKLNCAMGKKMKRQNRIFFSTENVALKNNFRPCACCKPAAYKKWKENAI
ncbi:MAG: Ada metal-binding domain-containing protein [Bacteroidota bacterium]